MSVPTPRDVINEQNSRFPALRKLRYRRYYTPDIKFLKEKKRHLLFYFCKEAETLKEVAIQQRIANVNPRDEVLYFGTGLTVGNNYVIKKDEGDQVHQDLLFRTTTVFDQKKIKGHVFGLTPEQIQSMDVFEGNSIWKKRERISVIAEDQATVGGATNIRRPHMMMYAFMGDESYFDGWRTFKNVDTEDYRNEKVYVCN